MNLLIAGDFCPNNRTAQKISDGQGGHILTDVAPLVKGCDVAIANLECPLTDKALQPITKLGPNLKAHTKAIKVLKVAGFNMVTLANNHILDFGSEGLCDTLQTLKEDKIEYIGAGNNIEEAQRVQYIEKKGQKVAIINCCEHEFSIATETTAGSNPLNPIQQYYSIIEAKKKADFAIVIVHGGHEHYQLPSPRMQETYRFFIDAGADVVINHHQHCYSGYELYNSKPIFYGLGNFCFDWKGRQNSKWNYGYMVELDLNNDIKFTLHPYEQCNATPDIKLLGNELQSEFEQEIHKLNAIIADPKALKQQHEKWMNKDERNWLTSLTPFTNQYILRLISRGYLPLWLPKRKIVALLNRISCEAHRDKLSYILTKQIK